MASKKDIVSAVVSHLENCVGQYGDYTLEESNIVPNYPNREETNIGIGWSDSYSRSTLNSVSHSVSQNRENIYGNEYGVVNVTSETYTENVDSQFIITIQSPTIAVLDELYEAVHKQFGKYKQIPTLQPSDFQTDVYNVSVTSTNSLDDESAENTIRRDQMTVDISFEREYVVDTDENISDIGINT